MKKLIANFGLHADNTCGCGAWVVQMNFLGVAGCRERRDEIVWHLKQAYGELTLLQKLKVAAKAILTFSVDPLNPFSSLLDEAIRRAEC